MERGFSASGGLAIGGTLLRIALFAAIIVFWSAVPRLNLQFGTAITLTIAPLLLAILVTRAGRSRLDSPCSLNALRWTTTLVHYVVLFLLGTAIFEALQLFRVRPLLIVPFPKTIGFALIALFGTAALVTVLNLAIKGLGAPFAVALSRRLATDWCYRYTRNPMLLATFGLLVAAALYLHSLALLLWLAIALFPSWIYFVKVYEERELEIRFGKPYLEYKARTPFLFPRRLLPR